MTDETRTKLTKAFEGLLSDYSNMCPEDDEPLFGSWREADLVAAALVDMLEPLAALVKKSQER